MRNLMIFTISVIILTKSKKHVIRDVPTNLWSGVMFRTALGIVGFPMFIYGLKMVPIFIASIITATRPFWVSFLGYLVLKEKVSKSIICCMIGCFCGVIIIALSKRSDNAHILENEGVIDDENSSFLSK